MWPTASYRRHVVVKLTLSMRNETLQFFSLSLSTWQSPPSSSSSLYYLCTKGQPQLPLLLDWSRLHAAQMPRPHVHAPVHVTLACQRLSQSTPLPCSAQRGWRETFLDAVVSTYWRARFHFLAQLQQCTQGCPDPSRPRYISQMACMGKRLCRDGSTCMWYGGMHSYSI